MDNLLVLATAARRSRTQAFAAIAAHDRMVGNGTVAAIRSSQVSIYHSAALLIGGSLGAIRKLVTQATTATATQLS
jgi:hypothetical protein